MKQSPIDDGQLGFAGLLATAEAENLTRQATRATAHLPATMAEALPFFRDLLDRHHAAMVAADAETAMQLRGEAHLLAERLNNFEPGILAHENAPGCVLERETAAAPGTAPLWGQSGEFVVTIGTMKVRIAMDGLFGIGAHSYLWLGFAAHVVEPYRPFLSETGYRSFLGVSTDLRPGLTPDAFAGQIVSSYVRLQLKGRLVAVKPEYRERCRNGG